MSKHPRADLYMKEREQGLTYRAIAEKYGVSYQAVAIAVGRADPARFKPYTEEQVVYPILRRWLNRRKITKKEFIRRMGYIPGGTNSTNLASWLKGMTYPSKQNIDKMLKVTGLTYEELFYREETQ